MKKTIRVAAAQTTDIIGEVHKASQHAIELVERAKERGVSLICFPEGYLQGYLASEQHVERFALSQDAPEIQHFTSSLPVNGPTVVLGFLEVQGRRFSNSTAIIQKGRVVGCYRKTNLLNHETMFTRGDVYPVFEAAGLRFGVNICSDMNFPETVGRVRDHGADLLVCCANNMLPREIAEKWKSRHNAIRAQRCRETGMWVLSSDVTGRRGNEVAWGPTSLLSPSGRVVAELPLNKPGLLSLRLN